MDVQQAIRTVVEGHDLSFDEMHDVMQVIMSGDATPAQISGLLIALRMKGETIEEIAAAASVMRELAAHVSVNVSPLIDTCGTGGDGIGEGNGLGDGDKVRSQVNSGASFVKGTSS